MKNFLDSMFSSYWGSGVLILLGLYLIRYTIKNPDKPEDKWLGGDVSGWGGGLGLILLGITIFIAKLIGKL